MKVTIRHLWLGLPVFVLLWKGFLFQLPLLDFWWHLKMGEIIASTKSIPSVDIFSFTAAGQPFVVQNWLGELIYYATYQMGGFPLLVFLHALLSVVAFLPVYWLCVEAASDVRIAAVVGFVAAFSAIGNIRPHVFSFVMFGLYYWVVSRYRSGRKDMLWTLPFLMVLWVNLHGAFVLGLILIAIHVCAEGLRRLIDGNRIDALAWNQIQKLTLVLTLCTIATLVNPEGSQIYEYVRAVMADAPSQQFVTEWQPPRIDEAVGVLVFYGAFSLALFVFIYSRKKPDLTELALFAAFSFLALKSLRNGAWFCMITYPIIARYLPLMNLDSMKPLRRFRIVDRVSQTFAMAPIRQIERPEVEAAHQRINILFVLVAVIILAIQSPWVRPTLYKTSLLDRATPIAAADFIAQHKLSGRIYHPQVFGDYLIWRLWPEQKSFFDGRVHLFGLEFVKEYRKLYHDSNWDKKIADWDIKYMLMSKSPTEEDSLDLTKKIKASKQWHTLFEDEISILFEKGEAPSISENR